MMAKESEIQMAIRDYLRWHKWYCFKIHQSLASHKGVADLYAIKGARSLWIEVKTPNPRSKQSKDQAAFGCAILDHGGEYLVARSVDEVVAYLAEISIAPKQHIW